MVPSRPPPSPPPSAPISLAASESGKSLKSRSLTSSASVSHSKRGIGLVEAKKSLGRPVASGILVQEVVEVDDPRVVELPPVVEVTGDEDLLGQLSSIWSRRASPPPPPRSPEIGQGVLAGIPGLHREGLVPLNMG